MEINNLVVGRSLNEVSILDNELPVLFKLKTQLRRECMLENYLRTKIDNNEKMQDYSVATDTVRCWIDEYNDLQVTAVNHHDELVEMLNRLVEGYNNDTLSWASWINAKELLSKLPQ